MSNIKLKQCVKGRYKFQVLDSCRKVKRETGWFDNLITDYGLESIGDMPGSMWGYCSVGSGTSTPAFGDTQLQSRVATTNMVVSRVEDVVNSEYAYRADTFEFSAGSAAGNLSEVGVGTSSNGLSLQSRALILDGNGNPTTITVLADEILQVTFEKRQYIPQTDVIGTVSISGTVYDYVLRAAEADTYTTNGNGWSAELDNSQLNPGNNRAVDGPIGTINSQPSGNYDTEDSRINQPYISGSHSREIKLVWDLQSANFATGIKSVKFETYMASTYQVEFTPAIPKNNTQILELNIQHSWGRL